MSESEDREEIRELLVKYCLACDAWNTDAYVGCFTEDALLDVNGAPQVGASEIRSNFEANRPTSPDVPPMQHFSTNVLVTVDGDEARANSYFLLVTSTGQPTVIVAGRYRDRLRRVNGSWVFTERLVRTGTAAFPEEAAATK